MKLERASRKKVKMKVGLSVFSGSGKTLSALLLSKGLVGDYSKIAVIDTENHSAELYSHLGEYNVLALDPPFEPERYVEAIRMCEKAGMEVIIIDSITHEWDGEGGILQIHEKETQKDVRQNSYTAWSKVTPRHNAFVQAILQSPCHVVTTVRRKQEYEMSKDEQGKVRVIKAGTREITRDNFEYELTLNFEFINDRHFVKASKDRTEMFMGKGEFIISEDTGRLIKEWCDSGEEVKETKESVISEYTRLLNSNIGLFSPSQYDQLKPGGSWTLKYAKDRLEKLRDHIAKGEQPKKSKAQAAVDNLK